MVFTLPQHASRNERAVAAYQQWSESEMGVRRLSDKDIVKALEALRCSRNEIREEIIRLTRMDEEVTRTIRFLADQL